MWILLFSDATLLEYNVSMILSPVAVKRKQRQAYVGLCKSILSLPD